MKFRMPVLTFLVAAAALLPSHAQDRRTGIDVVSYKITLKPVLQSQAIEAAAEVTFLPLADRTMSANFELHNALNITRVTDAEGNSLQNSRSYENFSVRVNFAQPLAVSQPVTIRFEYGGRLTGDEDSPIYGIRFASVQSDHAWLLYPGRWFPVSGYTADRYTMELNVETPQGYKAISSGIELQQGPATRFMSNQPGFPGSLAIVPAGSKPVAAQGVTTTFYFRGEAQPQAQPWGEETSKVMTYLTSIFGTPQQANMTIVETGRGAPAGYSAPGVLFVSSSAASREPSQRLLANQITRQWYGNLVSPVNRNHIWIANGMAKYAEILYQEHLNGAQVMEGEIRDLYVDAMTVTEAPVLQAARYEDYSPEFFAVTGSKGASTLHMLRGILGDDGFSKLVRAIPDRFANKEISTDDFRKVAEEVAGQNLQGFFIQWLESTGAPEFKTEYTIYRTPKGFRVRGKITQDLDTFRMPVELRIETEGNPEEKRVEVVGPQTEFALETFGKPKRIIVDPNSRVLRMSPQMRVSVAIRRGEQFAELGNYNEALKEYQRALEANRNSSLAHYRIAEVFFLQGNYQSAVNEFREALNGDLDPKWTEVWSHINMGKVFDVTQQRERAVNEYTQAIRTKDNTQGAQEEAARYMKDPYQRPPRQ
ncbi:MAG: tetratricopeptide repeat protein [Bryobacteraceae bacterium]|nr:tetratricopeptide repeat protein [Bryobacteraceae bacterium]